MTLISKIFGIVFYNYFFNCLQYLAWSIRNPLMAFSKVNFILDIYPPEIKKFPTAFSESAR
jgi:hypothetical protein